MGLQQRAEARAKKTFLEPVEEDDGLRRKTPRSSSHPALPWTCCREGYDGVLLESSHGASTADVAADAASVELGEQVYEACDVVPQPGAADGRAVELGRQAAGSLSGALGHEVRGRRDEGVTTAPTSSRGLTTVVVRNLPNDYTREMLLDLLDSNGLARRYDFLYLPTDASSGAGLGYAFVNLVSADDALRARERLEGFRQWAVPSGKVCSVGWSLPRQGLEANVKRYRNSPLMHPSVPDAFKPAVFADGQRIPFPWPTRKLRKPGILKPDRRVPF